MRKSLRHILSAGMMLFAVGTSGAEARPNTTKMSCKAAAALVASYGAIVLSTGPTTYDRYVSDGGYCNPDEITKPAFVPTADNPQCFIGYYCFQADEDDWR